MKTKTTIEELTQENLVDLLCTATYGSFWLEIYAPDREGVDIAEEDCLEDVWAKCLLAGKKIYCIDHYEEDEEDGKPTYLISLDDIKEGLQRCADGTFHVNASNYNDYGNADRRYISECYRHFCEDDGEMDNPEAEALMQIIIFGELIYG